MDYMKVEKYTIDSNDLIGAILTLYKKMPLWLIMIIVADAFLLQIIL